MALMQREITREDVTIFGLIAPVGTGRLKQGRAGQRILGRK